MKSTLIWLLVIGAVLLLGDTVEAWNRQIFNRNSRNFLRNNDFTAATNAANANTQMNEFNALFGINNEAGLRGGGGGGIGLAGGGMASDMDTGGFAGQQQEKEVYGIVEPLIEDTPCVDRPCEVNDDCCPTGVCVNTYGEGKCVYVYGRKRDLCHRNMDCEPGMTCLRGPVGNLICQQSAAAGTTTSLQILGFNNAGVGALANKQPEFKQFGEDCVSSSECNLAKSMCCQLQRSHHRMLPRKLCAYFLDPFTCVDIMPTENEEMRESRFLSSFSQRRM